MTDCKHGECVQDVGQCDRGCLAQRSIYPEEGEPNNGEMKGQVGCAVTSLEISHQILKNRLDRLQERLGPVLRPQTAGKELSLDRTLLEVPLAERLQSEADHSDHLMMRVDDILSRLEL